MPPRQVCTRRDANETGREETGEPSNQNQTLDLESVPLTGITTEIARAIVIALEEFQNTLPAAAHVPIPTPVPAPVPAPLQEGLDLYLQYFLELHPPMYKGEESPMETEDWIFQVKLILDAMNCPENKKVALATFLLEGVARQWWIQHLEESVDGRSVEQITWTEFSASLSRWFVPPSKLRVLQEKYLRLIQGEWTVIQYDREFTHLSHYAKALVRTEEDRCYRFREGLRDSIRQSLLPFDIDNYRRLVDAARRIELEQERVQRRLDFKQNQTQGEPQPLQTFGQGTWQHVKRKQRTEETIGDKEIRKFQNYPTCPKCNRRHPGDCLAASGICFKCHQAGHIARFCSGVE
ncbi:hypothetical protein KSP39_PZI020076 [Platanthera zijinensis]|uniref:CCHC-type domain-containing protein n=1 Tax=Platanthera zijinensis TaxID=2320716 RepID=A0AAP0AZH4_9ASPA